jgi:hypothetical protein
LISGNHCPSGTSSVFEGNLQWHHVTWARSVENSRCSHIHLIDWLCFSIKKVSENWIPLKKPLKIPFSKQSHSKLNAAWIFWKFNACQIQILCESVGCLPACIGQ